MKLAEQTAAKIELAIIERGWPLGMVIGSEADLLAEYGVSRAVLREAVRLLEHDHVAHMRRGPGGGLVVAEPDAEAVTRAATLHLRYRKVNPGQLFEARIALELAAVKSATERIDEHGIARLREVVEHEATGTEQADVNSHYFHLVVAQLSGNPALELFTDVMTRLSAAAFLGSGGLVDSAAASAAREVLEDDVASAHGGIADAIIAGDVGLAQHRTARHLQVMGAAVGRDPEPAASRVAGARRARRTRR